MISCLASLGQVINYGSYASSSDDLIKSRLQPSISARPAGWIYGKQVELTVPSASSFIARARVHRVAKIGRRTETKSTDETKDKDAGKEIKPGSWVNLGEEQFERATENWTSRISTGSRARYDKSFKSTTTAYRSPTSKDSPLHVQGKGDNQNLHHQDSRGRRSDQSAQLRCL